MFDMKCRLLVNVVLAYQHVVLLLEAGHIEAADNGDHPCLRTCEKTAPSMTCYYQFTVENYYTMSKACYNCPFNITDCYRPDCIAADGVKRMITVVNRSMPGPSIQVCLGDTVIVDVINKQFEEGTTIHWHGLHQKGTPYMDGVPFVTQCPILPHDTFQYKFKAVTAGTHFWHSHTGCQRSDGVFGALIIRKPRSDEFHSTFYSMDLPEHIIYVADWTHQSVLSKMLEHFHSGGNNKPDSMLINGRGRFKKFSANREYIAYTPLTTFNVKQGNRYRFRIINNGFLNCPVQISVDNHAMIIISSDGTDIQPVYVDTLVSYAGERWDIVLNANQNVSNYWIRFRGLLDCGPQFNSVFSAAILHYEGASDQYPDEVITYNNSNRNGLELNALNKGSGEFDFASVAEIRSVGKDKYDTILAKHPDISVTLGFDFYPVDDLLYHKKHLYGFYQVAPNRQIYTPQINHISLSLPSFPLLSQRDEIIKPDLFCNHSTIADDCRNGTFCHCTYVIDIPLNAVVELTLVDKGKVYEANHPFHLHGTSFRVLALEKLGTSTSVEEVESLDKSGRIFRNLDSPPIKDTVTIPDGGFTIIRFRASNPGYWLLHCHLDFHLEVGMGVILQVGKDDEMPQVPKHFPKCGNYRPHKDLNPQSILSTCDLEESCDVQTDNTNGIKKFVTKFLRLFNKASPMKTINRYIVFSFSILYIIRAL